MSRLVLLPTILESPTGIAESGSGGDPKSARKHIRKLWRSGQDGGNQTAQKSAIYRGFFKDDAI
jgi:hypothetical protein